MAPLTKKTLRARSNLAKAHHNKRLKKHWNNKLAELNNPEHPSGANGRVWSVHENFLILMSLKMLLQTYLEHNIMEIRKLNGTMIEVKVATMLMVRRDHVSSVWKEFLDERVILDKHNTSKNGLTAVRGSYDKKCLTRDQLGDIENEVELRHSEGRAVTNRLMRNFLRKKHNISVSKSKMNPYFKIFGLSYTPIKSKKRNMGAYRMDILRDFLIDLGKKYAEWKADPVNCKFVFVFTDESYVHRRHGLSNSYFGKKSKWFNWSSSKGKQVKIFLMHARIRMTDRHV
jgi:transposase